MYLVLLQDGILYRCLSGWLDLWYHSIPQFLCLDDLSIVDRGVLNSPTTTVLVSMCVFKFINVCLVKLGALTLGTY
jgi:hypothetical protein